MKRLVGLGKSKTDVAKSQPPPERGLNDIVESSNRKASMIDSQIAQCETELRKISQQMKELPVGFSKTLLQRKAKNILVRKKRYEQQAEELREKAFNMDSLASSVNAADDMKIIAGVMKSGTKELKKQLKKVDLDKVEDFQEELKDLIDMTDDVQAALSKNYDVPEDIDDDELNAQLEILGDEIVQDNDASYIDHVLKPPSGPSSGSLSFRSGPDNNCSVLGGLGGTTTVDEFGLPMLNLNQNVPSNSNVPNIPGGPPSHLVSPNKSKLNFK